MSSIHTLQVGSHQFINPVLIGGPAEVRRHETLKLALMIWPWHSPPLWDHPAARELRDEGYRFIIESGNLTPYSIEGADTEDCDYVILSDGSAHDGE